MKILCTSFALAALLVAAPLALSACADSKSNDPSDGGSSATGGPEAPASKAAKPTPGRVLVAHILVAFLGAERSTATRSKEEAEALAKQLLAQVRGGSDIRELMTKHSDDPGPGVYGIFTNPSAQKQGDYPRHGMAPAFGDVGFSLAVGETGLAPFDPVKSPFGWHVIQRLE